MSERAALLAPLPERVIKVADRPLYMQIPVPADGDPEVANVLWIGAVLEEAHRRGISLAELAGAADTGTGTYEQPAVAPERVHPSARRSAPPSPTQVGGLNDLHAAMRALHRWAGSPTFRELEQHATEARARVSKSVLQRALTPGAWPSHKAFYGLVRGCGLTHEETRVWTEAWLRVRREAANGHVRFALGKTTVMVPTDRRWWSSIRLEKTGEEEYRRMQSKLDAYTA